MSFTEPVPPIDFVCQGGVYRGSGHGGRRWCISSTTTGWHLEFLDPGDEVSTYAGTHHSLAAAQREANIVHGRPLQPVVHVAG